MSEHTKHEATHITTATQEEGYALTCLRIKLTVTRQVHRIHVILQFGNKPRLLNTASWRRSTEPQRTLVGNPSMLGQRNPEQ